MRHMYIRYEKTDYLAQGAADAATAAAKQF